MKMATWKKIESVIEGLQKKISESDDRVIRERARNYLCELDELEVFLKLEEVEIVSFESFERIYFSDFYIIDYDGQFCKLALAQNFGEPMHWYLYLISL